MVGGIVGVRFEMGADNQVLNCTIGQMSAQGVWLLDGTSRATIAHNLLYDCEHLVRIQSLQSTRSRCYYLYQNQCWNPRPASQSPKHLNTSFEGVDGQTISSTA
jgi:hypothetical protein